MASDIPIGATVEVDLPGGTYVGKVVEASEGWDFERETKYRVQGDEPRQFETITSARSLRVLTEVTDG